jgi:hypothetical protein
VKVVLVVVVVFVLEQTPSEDENKEDVAFRIWWCSPTWHDGHGIDC